MSSGYQTPADYYSAPPEPSKKSGFPRWLLFGCGGAGCLGLILIFALGAWMMKGGGGSVLSGFLVSQLQKDADEMFAPDVTPERREALKSELTRLKGYIDDDQVDLITLQSFLSLINTSIRDQQLTAEEVESLIEELERINAAAASKTINVRSFPSQPFPALIIS
ncbi:MAG TPA: hypothetical protein VM557_13915 [Thermoanaerobaculia bacterium]|nr:hypothetical protein [Thermoanaerobaculia bacterium]